MIVGGSGAGGSAVVGGGGAVVGGVVGRGVRGGVGDEPRLAGGADVGGRPGGRGRRGRDRRGERGRPLRREARRGGATTRPPADRLWSRGPVGGRRGGAVGRHLLGVGSVVASAGGGRAHHQHQDPGGHRDRGGPPGRTGAGVIRGRWPEPRLRRGGAIAVIGLGASGTSHRRPPAGPHRDAGAGEALADGGEDLGGRAEEGDGSEEGLGREPPPPDAGRKRRHPPAWAPMTRTASGPKASIPAAATVPARSGAPAGPPATARRPARRHPAGRAARNRTWCRGRCWP